MENALTITDLAMLRTIIETACDRGAFKASEMKQFGEIYDKLSFFLDTIQSQIQNSSDIDESPPASHKETF